MPSPHSVTRRGGSEGAQKIPATKAIQARTGLGIAASKGAIDRCLTGETVILPCPDAPSAKTRAASLRKLGCDAI